MTFDSASARYQLAKALSRRSCSPMRDCARAIDLAQGDSEVAFSLLRTPKLMAEVEFEYKVTQIFEKLLRKHKLIE